MMVVWEYLSILQYLGNGIYQGLKGKYGAKKEEIKNDSQVPIVGN
jgi:hypothetical protein